MNIIVINMDANMADTKPHVTKPHKLLKTPVPNELFYSFIDKIAYKMLNSNYYLIDVAAYKKATYCDECQEEPSLLQQFCNGNATVMQRSCNGHATVT